MKNSIVIGFICLLTVSCYSQNTSRHDFPSNFGDLCVEHIEKLASYGIRAPMLKSEGETLNYLASKLTEYGLMTSIEPFDYRVFHYDRAILLYNTQRVDVRTLFINPYLNEFDKEFDIEAELVLVHTPLKDVNETLTDKIVVVAESYRFFDLFQIHAKAIAVVPESTYQKLQTQTPHSNVSIQVSGTIEEHKSYNVIGRVASLVDNPHEIIISAHWDSKGGPGADDDASGISVLLELAKYFQQEDRIPFNLKFIAFGAEEVGMQGSQAYLKKHSDEFQTCLLNINLDSIGGSKEIMIELHQSSEEDIKAFQHLPSTVRFCAETDEKHRWIRISPEYYALTLFTQMSHIAWIERALKEASEALHITYRYGVSDGDHRIVSLAGIPVIGINVPGNRYHVPEDTPETISKTSLENVGKFVKEIITNSQFEKNMNAP